MVENTADVRWIYFWIRDGFLDSRWTSPLIGLKNQVLGTAWDITGQKLQGVGPKLKAVRLTFRDLASHLCQNNLRVAG